ncbi:16280_t:CDS:2 [Acaulospora colombiana]|uniref:16280_t:CDS:1 n=1 Tax=Acaulospora colombiana TaxID=27376 RepID=A0ACA9KX71_9GLOM|nr:16280_t:CDS:2 [Acaulospora colombiana]
MFQVCLQKYLSEKRNGNVSSSRGNMENINMNFYDTQVSRPSGNGTKKSSKINKKSASFNQDNNRLHITFKFFTHNRVLLLPFNTSFLALVRIIHARFGIDVSSLEYNNDFCQDFITVQGEEDWNLAKAVIGKFNDMRMILKVGNGKPV